MPFLQYLQQILFSPKYRLFVVIGLTLSPPLTHSWHACDNDYRHAMITDYDDDNNVVRGYYTTALHSWWGRGHHRRYSMCIGPKTTGYDDRHIHRKCESRKCC